jgi:hypothetical protein
MHALMPTHRPISIREEESQRRVAMVFNLVGAAHRAGLTKLSIHRAVDLVSRVTLKAGARDALLAIAREKPATWRGGDDEGRKRDRDALHRAVLRARKSAGGKPLQRGRKKKNARGPNRILEPTDLGLPDTAIASDEIAITHTLESECTRLRGAPHDLAVTEAELTRLRNDYHDIFRALDHEIAEQAIRTR